VYQSSEKWLGPSLHRRSLRKRRRVREVIIVTPLRPFIASSRAHAQSSMRSADRARVRGALFSRPRPSRKDRRQAVAAAAVPALRDVGSETGCFTVSRWETSERAFIGVGSRRGWAHRSACRQRTRHRAIAAARKARSRDAKSGRLCLEQHVRRARVAPRGNDAGEAAYPSRVFGIRKQIVRREFIGSNMRRSRRSHAGTIPRREESHQDADRCCAGRLPRDRHASGSPPNAAMFVRTHWSAAIWSRTHSCRTSGAATPPSVRDGQGIRTAEAIGERHDDRSLARQLSPQ